MSSLYRSFRKLFVPIALLLAAVPLSAQQRRFVLGSTIGLVGGGGTGQNGPNPTADGTTPPGTYFYEAYPSLQVKAVGRHSEFESSYAFGLSRSGNGTAANSDSHAASARLIGSAGSNWKFTVSDSFQVTANSTRFNDTRTSTPSSDAFRFIIDSAALNRSSTNNTASFSADYHVTETSMLSIGLTHGFLKYSGQKSRSADISDQQRISEIVTYSNGTPGRGTWNVTYITSYSNFKQFDDARYHTVALGYSHQIASGLKFRASGGPTYVRSSGSRSNYTSYNVQGNVQKVVKANTLSLNYDRESGETVGLGSVSDTNRASFSVSRAIVGNTSMFLDVSAFDVKSKLNDSLSLRGTSAAADFGFPAGKLVSLHCGGQYQKYFRTSLFPFEQKRVYLSLRLTVPELWKR